MEKDTLKKKFDVFYCRFFIHAITERTEKKLISFIKKNKKKKILWLFLNSEIIMIKSLLKKIEKNIMMLLNLKRVTLGE